MELTHSRQLGIFTIPSKSGGGSHASELPRHPAVDRSDGSRGFRRSETVPVTASGVPAQGGDLMVSQLASTNPVNGGSDVTYTVTVTNNGPSAGGGVTLTETIPANMTFLSVSAPGGWSCGAPSGGLVVCSTASMAASASANLQFTYRPNDCTGNLSTLIPLSLQAPRSTRRTETTPLRSRRTSTIRECRTVPSETRCS